VSRENDILWDSRNYGAETPLDYAGLLKGKAEVAAMLRRWVGTWEDFRVDVEDIVDAGDSVVVVMRVTGRGRGSGVPMEHNHCQLWSFKNQRVIGVTMYQSKADALRAAGLAE
jgi:ketosteroid isomerase-like protein